MINAGVEDKMARKEGMCETKMDVWDKGQKEQQKVEENERVGEEQLMLMLPLGL